MLIKKTLYSSAFLMKLIFDLNNNFMNMQNNLTPRIAIIGIIFAWAIWSLSFTYKYQKLGDNEKESLRESGQLAHIESKIIKQGLDLKGGMYIVLEADIPKLMLNLASYKDEILENIILKSSEDSQLNNFDFFSSFEKNIETNNLKLSRYYYDLGSSYDDIITSLKNEADDAIDRVLEILQNRIDQFGVSEPTIQKQGKQRIVIELAGIQDSERARALLQSTALLEFYLVKNPTLTNEIITQLDNDLSNSSLALDMTNSNQSEITEDINSSKIDVVDTSKSTTVSDLFGETSTESDTILVKDTIKKDALFSSLLVSLQGDLAVKESNLYNLKKLLE